jgi:hypothetical protein
MGNLLSQSDKGLSRKGKNLGSTSPKEAACAKVSPAAGRSRAMQRPRFQRIIPRG